MHPNAQPQNPTPTSRRDAFRAGSHPASRDAMLALDAELRDESAGALRTRARPHNTVKRLTTGETFEVDTNRRTDLTSFRQIFIELSDSADREHPVPAEVARVARRDWEELEREERRPRRSHSLRVA